ncbi:MAG: L-serine ammonia-lyase, iron-sulfur-dependent subunit beta [Lachnospiraceae bacterium]|nr:L-serine ammonia-lyase, iron-sulfur-dependent, subunit beta [Lachnospiraceae bacterium]MDE6991653.1 L-serine ammonia-lyase, iron-sulfur-dependent subunit beta [Lachnospiraceae bacterium]MDE7000172.1 L-serine ammonia-lyase, iron-sulfur-dependent subunit beta [Lachnospiraceae bacterium]
MAFISIFDVLGPNMVGPSSSHTAGACSIALLAHKILDEPASEVQFTLYGSFARTYKGHGTDRALLAGILGCSTDDIRIPHAYGMAEEQNLKWQFLCDETETELHPNTVDIHLTGISGKVIDLRGESIGGGKIRVVRINGIEVDFSGEDNTLIVVHRDRVGIAAHITSCLSQRNVNIAYMKLFRENKGDRAYSILEFDNDVPDDIKEKISEKADVERVVLIRVREGKHD